MRCAAVADHEGYRVWEDGTVESCWGTTRLRDERGRIKSVMGVLTEKWRPLRAANIRGYLVVNLRNADGSFRNRFVHHLVLEAFVGPRPAGTEARHFPDRDPTNNHVSNLSWGTPLENAADKVEHGTVLRGSRDGFAKLTEADIPKIRSLLAEGQTGREVAEQFGVSMTTVSAIKCRQLWKHV